MNVCPDLLTPCGDFCVDLMKNSMNCGGCGLACAAGLVCSNGACANACGDGFSLCGQSCVDTAGDSANCGACGSVCTDAKTCQHGVCARAPKPPSERSSCALIAPTRSAPWLPGLVALVLGLGLGRRRYTT